MKTFEPIGGEQDSVSDYFRQMEHARNYLNRAATAYHRALGMYSPPWVDYIEAEHVFELICAFSGKTGRAKLPLYKKNKKGAKNCSNNRTARN